MPAAARALWTRTYGETSYRKLPWFSPDPFPALVRAVEDGWLIPPGPVLDVGCGAGSNVLWLAAHGFRATGIDIAPGAIAAAESRKTRTTRNARFQVHDALALSLPPRSFRGAVDAGCFHTLPSRGRRHYAQGLARVLRPDATFLLSWVGREETRQRGPPHRLSVNDVAETFEPLFLMEQVEYRPRAVRIGCLPNRSGRPLTTLAGYTARLVRRSEPQPPPR
ncbi:MAG: class I SAM-dependent methyltransferase [Thermoplasmata archaeon]